MDSEITVKCVGQLNERVVLNVFCVLITYRYVGVVSTIKSGRR